MKRCPPLQDFDVQTGPHIGKDVLAAGRVRTVVIAALLVVAGVAVYRPVLHHPFIEIDDGIYVGANPRVLAGLTREGVAWAFQSLDYAANWHPLTWLSHMLDAQLHGADAGGHHLSGLLLHLATTLLLFFTLRAYTAATVRSAAVAALFAVHPLNVESVAWVAERKDVLSAFFWMATLAAYLRYVRSPGAARYAHVLAVLALGLMSKPMAVTLPCVLLLLDYWPLGRWRPAMPSGVRSGVTGSGSGSGWSLVREKAPLFALSAASAAVTVLAQSRGGAMKEAAHYPLGERAANAVVSCVGYLGKWLVPTDLAFFYPFPEAIPAGRWLGAAAVLALVTAVVLVGGRTRPFLPVGWLWWAGMLIPVSGLVRIGGQAMADRYMYLPGVGLSVALVWSAHRAAGGRRPRLVALSCAAAVSLALLGKQASSQVGLWRDSGTLAGHALGTTTRNWMAHSMLCSFELRRGAADLAALQCREALAVNPRNVVDRDNLGVALTRLGRRDEAVRELREAVATDPSFFSAQNNLGVALAAQGRLAEAVDQYRAALGLRPESVETLNNLGSALLRSGRPQEAQRHLAAALRLAPRFAFAHYNLAAALEMQGLLDEAAGHYRTTLLLTPADDEARAGLARVLARAGPRGESR